jgi:hypothetical protein
MHIAFSTAARAALATLALAATLALGACTTAEGTNAFSDFGTFEREVMNSTARGVGLIPGEPPREDLTAARAPLVLPRGNSLPAPTTSAAAARLPADSDQVQIDTAGLSEQDIAIMRNTRVVDMRTTSGRPLTEAEANQLTARMRSANMPVIANNQRPLYLPPAEYFTRVGDADLVCSTPSGEIVSLSDSRCPEEVRRAMRTEARNSGLLGTGVNLSDDQIQLDD